MTALARNARALPAHSTVAAIRVSHPAHGSGSFDRLAFPIGEAMAAMVLFDDGIARRVAVADLTTEPPTRRLVDDAEIGS